MKTIKLCGGLGNQMFQYALYKAFVKRNMDVCIDDVTYYDIENKSPHLANHLDIFKGKYQSVTNHNSILRLLSIERFLHRLHLPIDLVSKCSDKAPSVFDDAVFYTDAKYISGYWQSEKYFTEIATELKDDLEYIGEWSESNLAYRERILTSNSVSVHIRRGDYLTLSDVYGGICTEDYYKKSIEYIKDKETNPIFFIFTNDIEWCKLFFDGHEEVVFVQGNEVEHSYMDMILMTYCKHHIIANSSFSWWGAWLSKHKGITIAPSRWLNNRETPDIWCDGWIKL